MASANVTNSNPMESIKDELSCCICHNYFVNAYTLLCSHSYCLTCIESWRKHHSDCPMCRKKINGMAPSRALNNMVAAFHSSGGDAPMPMQSSVNKPAKSKERTQPPTYDSSTDDDEDEDYFDYSDGAEDYFDDDDDEEEEEEEEEEDWEDVNEEEHESEGGEGDEEDWEDAEEEEDEEGDYGDETDDDDYESDDEEHAKRSNENNPNNAEYWKVRGWSGRPDNWKELYYAH